MSVAHPRDPDHQGTTPPDPAGQPLLGRSRELDIVSEVLDEANHGTRLCFLSGEAGIGKTRLAIELANVATDRGWRVLWGHGWHESGAAPYWPWTQIARQLAGSTVGINLAPFVIGEGQPLDRFELFDATAATLHAEASRTPLMVVLDDLHLADPPTIALLGFIATHLNTTPLLVVATYRDRDMADRQDLAEHRAALERLATVVHLRGLDVDSVGQIIGNPDRAAELHTVTGGNPLFVEQARRGDIGRTDTLVSVLTARVASLGHPTARTIAGLALLGRTPPIADLAALLDVDEHTIAAHIDSAVAAGHIHSGTTELTHPLVGDAALALLDDDERVRLHGTAADHVFGGDASPSDRAYHLLNAGPERWRDAVEACRAAAAAASGQFAHEDANAHLSRALEVAHRHGADAAMLARLTFDLAGSTLQSTGRTAAEPLYLAAWDHATTSDDPQLIATVGARHGIQYFFAGGAPHPVADRARIALDRLGDGTTALHARLHACLGAELVVDEPAEARGHAQQAVEIARLAGEPVALASALIAEQVTDLGPATLRRRLRTAREIIALAEANAAHDLAVHGHFLLMGALLERGEVGELDALLVRQDQLIDEYAAPRFARHALWFRCTRAMFDGDPDAVERIAGECFAIAERLSDPDGIGVFGAQYGISLWMRGRVIEMESAYVDQRRAHPNEPVWSATLAWLWGTHGRIDEARGALDRLPPVAELPSNQHLLLTMATMAGGAIATADDDLAADLWEALLPYADHVVPIAMGAGCWGVIAHHLGALAHHLGRTDQAAAHFEQAISICARLGARPWLVDAQLCLAAILLDVADDEHQADPDIDRVQELVDQAAAAVDELGLAVFAELVANLHSRLPRRAPHLPQPSTAQLPRDLVSNEQRPSVSVLGTFEVNAIDGSTPRWTSRKARQLLKILVARRGTPVSRDVLMDLLWPDEDPIVLANRLSVALSTIRRSLDPGRTLPTSALIVAQSNALRLDLDNVEVDSERFLAIARRAVAAHQSGARAARELLREARLLHGGDALPDEPYADWAEGLRSEVAAGLAAVLRCDAEAATNAGDHLGAADAWRELLEADPYDEAAHLGLIAALQELGAHGQADTARGRYLAAMSELGIPVDVTLP